MELLEFLETLNIICDYYQQKKECEKCILFSNGCALPYSGKIKDVVKTVEEWRKDNISFKLTTKQIKVLEGRYYEGFNWIARNENSKKVNFFKNRPNKSECYNKFYPNSNNDILSSYVFSDVFQFVTFENSPVNIKELLQFNGVDIDDDTGNIVEVVR